MTCRAVNEEYVLNSEQFIRTMRITQLPQSELCLSCQYGCPWQPRFTRPLHSYIFSFGFTNLSIFSFSPFLKNSNGNNSFFSWALKQSTLPPDALRNLCPCYSVNHHNFLIGSRIEKYDYLDSMA